MRFLAGLPPKKKSLNESVMAVPGIGKKISEQVDPADVHKLSHMYAAGEIDIDELKDRIDSLAHTDYTMRQGEMGNPDMRDDMAWGRERGEWDELDALDHEEEDDFEEGIELAPDQDLGKPGFYIGNLGTDEIVAGPFNSKQEAESATRGFAWYSPSKCFVDFGSDEDGYFVDAEGGSAKRELGEKSTSEKQARFMAAAAHDPAFAKKNDISQSVAKEFNKADTGTKQLSNAMKHKSNEGIGDPKPMDPRLAARLHKEVSDRKWANHKADDEKAKQNQQAKPMEEDESEMQTQGTVGRNNSYAQSNQAMASQGNGANKSGVIMPEAYDMNNGYDDEHEADEKGSYPGFGFPNGADGPVLKKTGAAGARQGDNPEQKTMAVSEDIYKELVYKYRSHLKESGGIVSLKKN